MTDNNLLLLPLDILAIIFKYLKTSDLRNLMLACKSLRNIIVNETRLWRPKFQNELIIQCERDINSFTLYDKCRISYNWRKGIFMNKVIIRHKTKYMPWLKFYDSKALFLSVGDSLQCFSIDKRKLHRNKLLWYTHVPTVKRHDMRTNDISRFIYKENVLACGNRDGSLAIYNLEDYTKKPILMVHIKHCHLYGLVEVSDVEIIKDMIVTVSKDSSSISFWQWESEDNTKLCEPKNITLSEDAGCRCLAANKFENQIAIGLDGNSKPYLLDVATSELLMCPKDSSNKRQVIRDIKWRNENTFVVVNHSGKLEMFDTRTGQTVYETTDPFQSSLYCVRTDSENAIVVGSSEYSRCVLYDVRRPYHVQMYFTQKRMSPVYSLDFDTTKLIAAADLSVAVLNYNISAANEYPKDYSHYFERVSY